MRQWIKDVLKELDRLDAVLKLIPTQKERRNTIILLWIAALFGRNNAAKLSLLKQMPECDQQIGFGTVLSFNSAVRPVCLTLVGIIIALCAWLVALLLGWATDYIATTYMEWIVCGYVVVVLCVNTLAIRLMHYLSFNRITSYLHLYL